jgi:hypothetical protein
VRYGLEESMSKTTIRRALCVPLGLLVAVAIALSGPGGAVLLAAPQVTIVPRSGPAGTRFVATGAGFTPGETLLYGYDSPSQPVILGRIQVNANGGFTVTVDSTGLAPREYAFHISSASTPPPPPLAVVPFTVTAGGAPGLPATGGGGGIGRLSGERLSVSGASALAGLLALGCLALTRRRSFRRR